MDYISILNEAFFGCLKNIGQIALIVIPLMVFIEILKDLNALERLTGIMTPITSLIGISKEARLPILAGLVFGISYGGGIIIESAKAGKLTYDDIYITNLFLVICHSVFEDTLLFAAIGAKWLPVLLVRLVLAILICYIVNKVVRSRLEVGRAT